MNGAPIRYFLAEPPDEAVRLSLERLARSKGVVAIAAMPDLHLAGDVCIGTALLTTGALYPAAVGGDIGCGVMAVGFSRAEYALEESTAARIIQTVGDRVPILRHRQRQPLPDDLADRRLSHPSLARRFETDGALQLGTLGRGNHFIELQLDGQGNYWLMVHSGSRSFGQAVRDHHVAKCETSGGGLPFLASDSEQGQAYLGDMEVARQYASVNRRRIADVVAEVVAEVVGASVDGSTAIDCDHNHCRAVTFEDRPLWIHRKGAISAQPGELGVIPGSMGSASYHVAGRGSAEGLWSSSHGAGRTMSREAARRRISITEFERQTEGVWFDHRQAHRLRDEAPGTYKDITKVMRAQRELTRIVRELRPVLSFKGA